MAVTSRMFQRHGASAAVHAAVLAGQSDDNEVIVAAPATDVIAPYGAARSMVVGGSDAYYGTAVSSIGLDTRLDFGGGNISSDAGSMAFGVATASTALGGTIRSLAGGLAFGQAFATGAGRIIASTGCLAFGQQSGSSTIMANGYGSVAGGRTTSDGSLYTYFTAFAWGYSGGSGDAIRAYGTNAVQFGPGLNNEAASFGVGKRGEGFRLAMNGKPTDNLSNGDMWVANDKIYGRSDGEDVRLSSYVKRAGNGSFAQTSSGSAWGYAYSAGGYVGLIEASGAAGATAFGFAYGGDADTTIQASSSGAIAFGYAYSVKIEAGGQGSFAGGNAQFPIEAQAAGSMAFGFAFDGGIYAQLAGSIQFGPGTNNVANSLKVGESIRIHGPSATPATPVNGDIWENSGNVYIRSGGVTVTIS